MASESSSQPATSGGLRLKAVDAEDLAVVAACLQDALVMVSDMVFLPEERRFVLVANRFVWERAVADGSELARTATGVSFEDVTAVQRRDIDLRRGDLLLSLLTIVPVAEGVELTFSGGPAIRLQTQGIRARIQDVGDPWPTQWRPKHEEPTTPV